jgi:glycosyltransferase involved in cell wall biosynthesis
VTVAPRAGRASILFLCQILPYPLDAGPKVRAYHMLRWLAERADVTLVCFVRDDDPPEALEPLRGFCAEVIAVAMRRSRLADAWHLARALVTGRSFILLRDERRAMRQALAALCLRRRFDAVHADQLWMAGYARALDIPLKLLDDHNAVYLVFERLAAGLRRGPKRWILAREARKIAGYEAAQVEDFDGILFVSEEDRAAMARVSSPAQASRLAERSQVLPICLDSAAVRPIQRRPAARRILILGTMFWPPNAEGVLWFAEKVFAQVLAAVPEARLTVIGKRPPASIAALAEGFGGAMEVLGYVPELQPYLEECAVFAVPLLSGGGMRVKILDAWAWQLPVLSTTIGAEGITIRPGEDIAIADAPEDFAAQTIRLLREPAEGARMAAAGRAALEERYDAARVYQALSPIYAKVLGP